MRRHAEHVRTAYLTSLVILEDRVPLYHAESAQLGLDQLFKDCDEDVACNAAYPRLGQDFAKIMNKMREHPVSAFVHHPVTGARTEIHLTERTFADCVRVMMYRTPRDVPFLIEKAAAGDFGPFAEAGLKANRGVYEGGGMGLSYTITCNEFVSRIKPDEIEPATRGSYLGAWRVRDQMAACKYWPKTELPANYFEPFRLETPIVLVSGSEDSAAPPSGEKKPNRLCLTRSTWSCPEAHTLRKTNARDRSDTSCSAPARRRILMSDALAKCSSHRLNYLPTVVSRQTNYLARHGETEQFCCSHAIEPPILVRP